MANYCSKCGQKLADGDIFCDNCGEKVVDSSPPSTNENSNNASNNSQPELNMIDDLKKLGKVFTGIVVVGLIIVFVLSYISVTKNEDSRNNSPSTTSSSSQSNTPPPSTVSEDLSEVEKYIKVGDEQVEFTNHQQAVDCYKKAIDLNPNPKTDKGYFDLGLAYFSLGHALPFADPEKWKSEILNIHRSAVAAFQKAVEINPKYAEAYSKLGLAYIELGDSLLFVDSRNLNEADNNLRNANSAFQKAVEINPKHAETYVGMAVYYLKLKNYDAAMTNINKALEIEPSNSDYQDIYQALLQMRNWAR